MHAQVLFTTNRRQIDIMTYQLLFFLPDTSLCLFDDEMFETEMNGKLEVHVLRLNLHTKYIVLHTSSTTNLATYTYV